MTLSAILPTLLCIGHSATNDQLRFVRSKITKAVYFFSSQARASVAAELDRLL